MKKLQTLCLSLAITCLAGCDWSSWCECIHTKKENVAAKHVEHHEAKHHEATAKHHEATAEHHEATAEHHAAPTPAPTPTPAPAAKPAGGMMTALENAAGKK